MDRFKCLRFGGILLALVLGIPAAGVTLHGQFFHIVLPPATAPSQITAGNEFTCVRKFNGDVFCWGLNTSSQIGIMSTANCSNGGQIPCVDRPQFILPGTTKVSTGAWHACALTGGLTKCWGTNYAGQLGDGTANSRATPTPIASSLQFSNIDAGSSTTCGVTSAGEIACWGLLPYNGMPYFGRNNTNGWSATPVTQITHAGFRSVEVGFGFICIQFDAYGWRENDCKGFNSVGQLGSDGSWMPKDYYGQAYAPWFVGTTFTPSAYRVSAGPDFQCADMVDNTVRCAGSNSRGKLGAGDANVGLVSSSTALPVGQAGSPMQLHSVTTGVSHACALDFSGQAWCWGASSHGQLGNGVKPNPSNPGANNWFSPQLVAGGLTFSAIAAGFNHTCGIATDYSVHCWGSNDGGQLGIGYTAAGIDTSLTGTPVQYTALPRRLAAF
jgi:alpha-tubulin suppressor-like RCC1 family protein